MKIFLDSSVIIAALLSEKGGSAKIVKLCEAKLLKIYISEDVIKEIEEVLGRKMPEAKPLFKKLLVFAHFKKVTVTVSHIKRAKAWISDENDAKILAAAKQSKVDYLITLDINDFIRDSSVSRKSGLVIVTPADFLQKVIPWSQGLHG